MSELSPRPFSTGRTFPARRIVQRHPLTAFFVLSCLFSWWAIAVYLVNPSLPPIAGFGPFLAALTVLGYTDGRAGIRRLLRSMVRWRVPCRAYLAAIGLPMAATGAAVAVNLALGAQRAADLALWTEIPVTIALMLLIPGLGGAWEEPGFRGFALGRLEQRYGRLAGPLLLGGFWVFWHLPLFVVGQILPTDVPIIIAASVVVAALFHSARDSVLIAMLFHASNNAISGEYASQLFTGVDAVRLGVLTAVAWWLVAAIVVLWRRRTNDNSRATPATPPHIEPGPAMAHHHGA